MSRSRGEGQRMSLPIALFKASCLFPVLENGNEKESRDASEAFETRRSSWFTGFSVFLHFTEKASHRCLLPSRCERILMHEIFHALSNFEAQTFGGITPDILTRNLLPVAVLEIWLVQS